LLLCALLTLALLPPPDDGAEAGRRGNALYEQGAYAEAEAAYRSGLQSVPDTTTALYARLQNNLGAALYRQEKFGAARRAFRRSAEAASELSERVQALYNAGNAAAGGGQLTTALDRYRQVLRLDPTHEPARFNYEFLKREMARRQEKTRSQEPPDDVEPSPYAKRLKRRAEAMAAERRYDAAHRLLERGLARDSTVAAYQRFMARLEDVATIHRTGAVPTTPNRSLRSAPSAADGSP
jgi:tetratricopeptide (TPR) repeat protein